MKSQEDNKIDYKSLIGICVALRPIRATLTSVDEYGSVVSVKEYGDFSETCRYCGKRWDEHNNGKH